MGDTEQKPAMVVSVDIETTGPSPAVASMLSVGAIAYDDAGTEVATFYATMSERKRNEYDTEPMRDAATMEWWAKWPEQWALATLSPRPPLDVMQEFAEWLEGLPGRPLFLAWPAGFDWQFVCFYLWEYVQRNPFGYSPLCIKAFGAGLVGKAEAMLSSREESLFPPEWIVTPEFPHHALHDARAQGRMWLRLKAHAEQRRLAP